MRYGVSEDLVCTPVGATSDIPSWATTLPPNIVFVILLAPQSGAHRRGACIQKHLNQYAAVCGSLWQ